MIPTLFDDCGGILLQAHKEGFQRTTDLEELNLCTYRLLPKTLKLMLSFPQSLKKLRLIEVCQGFKESYPNEDLGSTVYMGAIFQQRLSLEEVYIHNVGGGRLGCGFGLCPQLRVLSIDAFTLFGARLLNRHGDMMDPNHQTVPTFAYFLPRSLEHLTLFYETSPDLARGPWFMPDYGLNFLLYALAAQKRERVPRLRTVTLTAVSREVIPEPEPAPVEDFFEFDEVWVGFVWNMIIIEPSPVERPE
ncbi:MAG: tRNA methyltransferase ppm2 [Chaenotheca gracillima]|nr:MAG: tRNA methyltransferase ppm2 [Chaenotheca gracillima]